MNMTPKKTAKKVMPVQAFNSAPKKTKPKQPIQTFTFADGTQIEATSLKFAVKEYHAKKSK